MKERNPVSVVIRTKNESQYLGLLLTQLHHQTFNTFKIVIIDNNSTDRTLEIAHQFNVDKIISLPDEEFSHPYSTNLGMKNSQGELVILTNGHCVPMSNTWLEAGLENFDNPDIAGIDGHSTTGHAAKTWQKIIDRSLAHRMHLRLENLSISTTNAIIRKGLWEEYPFDETLEECEDYDWSKEMIARGYKVIKDPNFNVFHYHPLTILQLLKRNVKWRSMREELNKRQRPRKSFSRFSTINESTETILRTVQAAMPRY
jgi:rhamnosyltransferase